MVFWSCSSCLRGFIPRAAWMRHYTLLSPRPTASLPIHHFSSSARRSTKKSAVKAPMHSSILAAKAPMEKSAAKVPMYSSREPFYVIRKGDVIGICKTLSDCQAQVSNSVRTINIMTFPSLTKKSAIAWFLAYDIKFILLRPRYATLQSRSTKAILCVKKLRNILLRVG
jgi:hypothetical protein